jgi:ABC-2 type transport system permease protein
VWRSGTKRRDPLTVALRYGSAAVGIVRRDLAIFVSYRLRFASQVASTGFSLLLLYYVSKLVRVDMFASPDDYFAFATVGVVIFGVLTSTLAAAPATLRQELVAGTYERLLVSPFGAVAGTLSMLIFPFVYGLAHGIVTVLLAVLLFGLPVEWPSAALALPVAVLGVLAFLPFAIVITAAVLVLKQAMGASSFVVAGISVVAGLYFPVALLPDWIGWASQVQPFTPAVDLLRHLMVGTELDGSPWTPVAKLAFFAGALIPVAVWVLDRALRLGRRHATITEY